MPSVFNAAGKKTFRSNFLYFVRKPDFFQPDTAISDSFHLVDPLHRAFSRRFPLQVHDQVQCRRDLRPYGRKRQSVFRTSHQDHRFDPADHILRAVAVPCRHGTCIPDRICLSKRKACSTRSSQKTALLCPPARRTFRSSSKYKSSVQYKRTSDFIPNEE